MLINRRRGIRLGVLTPLLFTLSLAGAGSASAAEAIETMPLSRLQVRITTGTDGTDGHPTLRLNSSTTGVRTLNPPAKSAFDAGHVDTYDLRLLASPSQITMLRVGIAGNDAWCVQKVELLFNGKVAFARDAVPGGACATIRGGSYIEYSSADLRTNAAWTQYGTPPPLPNGLNAASLRALVTHVTGSAMLSSPGVSWDPAVALTMPRQTSSSIHVAFGIWIVDPSGIDSAFTATVSYDIRLFVGSDGRLHATKANASCCYHFQMSVAVVGELDTALSRMTARPTPHNPLRFGVDALTNIAWSYVPVIG